MPKSGYSALENGDPLSSRRARDGSGARLRGLFVPAGMRSRSYKPMI